MGPAGCGRVPGRAVGEGGWPLSAVAARGAVDEPTAVRRGLHGPPAAAGEPWGASAVRMGSRGRPDELWSFPATRGAGWRAGGGRGGAEGGAGTVGGLGRRASGGAAGARLDRGAAVRGEAGGCGERVQSAEEGAPLASPTACVSGHR